VFAELESGRIRVSGMVGTPDGARVLRAEHTGPAADPEGLANVVAEELLAQGAGEIIAALG
jgi:hydroxymethylbilane synthase